MRMQQMLDGIVLRTYDVGEADRLCIVFTRERGRIPMRARAVRKMGSRMGALLLPGRRLMLDVRDDGTMATVAAAQLKGDIADLSDPVAFAAAQQGIELLLLLVEDDEPLPGVFDMLFQFLHVCGVNPALSRLAFHLRLFHVLGLLPSHVDDRRFHALTERERSSVRLAARVDDFGLLCAELELTDALVALTQELQQEHTLRELKSSSVLAALEA